MEAARLLGKNRAPGSEGFPVEFDIMFWQTLGPLLLEVLNERVQQKRICRKFLKGLIVLLHKKGVHTKLTNKRGITLINVSSKIGTKVF
jgi:hypothetical protein